MTADPRADQAFIASQHARLQAEHDQRRRDEALAQAQARLEGRPESPLGDAAPLNQPINTPVHPQNHYQAASTGGPIVEPPTARLDPIEAPPPRQATANAPSPHPAPYIAPEPVAAPVQNTGSISNPAPGPNPVHAPQPVLPTSHMGGHAGGQVSGDESLDFLGGERNAQDFLRANRHSGRVRVLRIALPLIGIFILSVVIGAYLWTQSGAPSVSIQSASMDDGRMVMSNPKIDGVDDRQRPYTLIAREAIQDPADLGKVELTAIDAKVPMDEGIFAKILAGKGFYDADAKTLKLDESVDIRTDDGVTMIMQDADVDMDAGNLVTGNPVSIKTEQAEVSADSFTVENNGEKVVFQDRVRMTIFPGKFDQAERAADQQQSADVQN